MEPESPLRGPARQWYLTPVVGGLALMLFSILILVWPWLLALMFAIPIFLAGLGFFLFGLDLWHGAAKLRRSAYQFGCRMWPRGDE